MIAIGTLLALLILTALHGLCVLREQGGYRRDPRFKWHPELRGLRFGDRLLVFRPKDSETSNEFEKNDED